MFRLWPVVFFRKYHQLCGGECAYVSIWHLSVYICLFIYLFSVSVLVCSLLLHVIHELFIVCILTDHFRFDFFLLLFVCIFIFSNCSACVMFSYFERRGKEKIDIFFKILKYTLRPGVKRCNRKNQMTWHKKMKEEKNRTTIIYHWIGCNPFIMHICDNNVSTVFNGTLWGFSYANKHICAYTYNDCEYCDRYWSKSIERMKLNIVWVCLCASGTYVL